MEEMYHILGWGSPLDYGYQCGQRNHRRAGGVGPCNQVQCCDRLHVELFVPEESNQSYRTTAKYKVTVHRHVERVVLLPGMQYTASQCGLRPQIHCLPDLADHSRRCQ